MRTRRRRREGDFWDMAGRKSWKLNPRQRTKLIYIERERVRGSIQSIHKSFVFHFERTRISPAMGCTSSAPSAVIAEPQEKTLEPSQSPIIRFSRIPDQQIIHHHHNNNNSSNNDSSSSSNFRLVLSDEYHKTHDFRRDYRIVKRITPERKSISTIYMVTPKTARNTTDAKKVPEQPHDNNHNHQHPDPCLYILQTIDMNSVTPNRRNRMRQEILNLTNLQHTHILRVVAVYTGDNIPTEHHAPPSPAYSSNTISIVTELVSGGDLASRVPVHEARARTIMTQILQAVLYLHQRGIHTHHLTTGNILYADDDPQSSIKITHAALPSSEAALQNAWSSSLSSFPEDDSSSSPCNDVAAERQTVLVDLDQSTYDIGVIAYQLLTGREPPMSVDSELYNAVEIFTSRNWKQLQISQAAKDFIKHCMQPGFTVTEAIESPWIQQKFSWTALKYASEVMPLLDEQSHDESLGYTNHHLPLDEDRTGDIEVTTEPQSTVPSPDHPVNDLDSPPTSDFPKDESDVKMNEENEDGNEVVVVGNEQFFAKTEIAGTVDIQDEGVLQNIPNDEVIIHTSIESTTRSMYEGYLTDINVSPSDETYLKSNVHGGDIIYGCEQISSQKENGVPIDFLDDAIQQVLMDGEPKDDSSTLVEEECSDLPSQQNEYVGDKQQDEYVGDMQQATNSSETEIVKQIVETPLGEVSSSTVEGSAETYQKPRLAAVKDYEPTDMHDRRNNVSMMPIMTETHEEFKELEQIFLEVHSDMGGNVTVDEVHTRLRGKYTESEVNSWFQGAKYDNSRNINYTEFLRGVIRSRRHIERLRVQEAFATLDKGKQGYVTVGNLRAVLGSDNSAYIEQLMKEADTKKDGRITYAKFQEVLEIACRTEL